MFTGNSQDMLNLRQKQETNHIELMKQFGKMGDTLQSMKDGLLRQVSENIVLSSVQQPFAANGYLYNSVYISDAAANDAATLKVSKGAVYYSIPLQAGENAVNIPDGSSISASTSSGNAVTALLTRYNTPGNNDTNVTPFNTAGKPLYTMSVGSSGAGQAVNSDGSTNVKITDGINTAGLIQMSGDSVQSNAIGTNSGSFGFVYNGTTWDRLRSANAANDNASGLGLLSNVPRMFNGSGLDRVYNNTQGTLLASAARTGNTLTPTQTNYNAKGAVISLDVTIASGTGGLTIYLMIVDPVTGKSIAVTPNGGSITTTGTYSFIFYPSVQTSGLGSGVKQSVQIPLPRTWFIQVSHGDTSSYTYSLGYALIL